MIIKVLIVDDHQLVRYGFKSLLDSTEDIKVIGEADTGEAAIEFVKENPTDVILMDLRMPGIGGMEATKKIMRFCPESRILVVTACVAEPFPTFLMEAGAKGFLSKDASDDELLAAVRAVASGEEYISPEIQESMRVSRLNGGDGSPFNNLTDKELQVALMLISGKKPKEIGAQMFIDPKTVCTYRYRIWDKLGTRSDMGVALLAVRYGIIDDIPM